MRVGIRANTPAILPRLADCLPPDWKPAPSPIVERLYSIIAGGPAARAGLRRFNLLYGDAERLARSYDLEQVIDAFESDVKLYIAEKSRGRIFIHAGVVGWNGKAIVMPGRTFSGKSTLVQEMVKAGAVYYSDEYALLDDSGRVHPYLKPLSLRRSGGKPVKIAPEEMNGEIKLKPIPVGLVIVSRYAPGAKWRPRELTRGRGALELLANTVSARRYPEIAFARFEQAMAQATIVKSNRGEAVEVVASIIEGLSWHGITQG